MLVLVPSVTHIWERMIPGGGVHCHWKEPSLATVQERLAADTTLSGPCGTCSSMEGGCRNVIGVVGRAANERGKSHFIISYLFSRYIIMIFICPSHSLHLAVAIATQSHSICDLWQLHVRFL